MTPRCSILALNTTGSKSGQFPNGVPHTFRVFAKMAIRLSTSRRSCSSESAPVRVRSEYVHYEQRAIPSVGIYFWSEHDCAATCRLGPCGQADALGIASGSRMVFESIQ